MRGQTHLRCTPYVQVVALAIAAVIMMSSISAHPARIEDWRGDRTVTKLTARQTGNNDTLEPLPNDQHAEFGLVQPVWGECSHHCVRKEVSSLTENEWNRFSAAINKLHTGGGGGLTSYEMLVQEHIDNAPRAHGNDAFLPWHRYFVARIEQSLQQFDPEVCVPYWDWSRSFLDYRSHPVFSAKFAGSPQPGCIPDGAFHGWNTRQSGSNCVRRELKPMVMGSAPFIKSLMRFASNYSDFRLVYETLPHAGPHVGVGGPMSVMSSPSDPIFWMHHAMVDKHYMEYQDEMNGGEYPNPDERLVPWGTPIKELRHSKDWCYSYDASPIPLDPEIRQPSPIPDDWLRMSFGDNNVQIDQVKMHVAELTRRTNGLTSDH